MTSAGWKAVPLKFIQRATELGVTSEEFMFIVVVHSFASGSQTMFPKIDTIAKMMGVSRYSVTGYIRSLRNKGLLSTRRLEKSQVYNFENLYEDLDDLEDRRPAKQAPPKPAKVADLQKPLGRDLQKPPYRDRMDSSEEEDSPSENAPSRPSPLAEAAEASLAEEKKRRVRSRKKSHDSFALSPQRSRVEKSRARYNCNDLGGFMQKLVKVKFGHFMGQLTGKDRKQLKRLIDEYGAETMCTAAEAMITKWEEFQRLTKVQGFPNPQVLYGYRRTVVPWSTNPEAAKAPNAAPHFTKEKERPDGEEVGWGEEFLEGL